MSSAQIKLNEIIRLCTDLSTSIHDNNTINSNINTNTNTNITNLNQEEKINYDIIPKTQNSYSKRLIKIDFKDSYSVGELYIRCLGTCEDSKHNTEETKWCSIIEKTEEKCFILRGELIFPFKVNDIIYRDNIFTYVIDFDAIQWENDDIPELLENSEESSVEEEDEEEDGDYEEDGEEEDDDGEEEDTEDDEEDTEDDEEKKSDETSEEIIVH